MAENSEIDVIKHLLEIEKEASQMINDAKIEAEKRISDARNKYNALFRESYDSMISKMEAEYQNNVKETEENHNKEIESFKNSLESKSQNKEEFAKFLDSYLS